MLRLSIIVPFYNVEPYVEECIRSLYDQDIPMEEYEVICVDDCSLDGSRGIVERLQKEYPTLKLLCHTENKRQGGARNTGLREARGKYIWFVDSDDYIEQNCLRELLLTAESEELDLLKFYYELCPRKIEMISSPVVTGTELIFDVETGEAPMDKCCTVWCQLIKADLITKHKISFAEKHQYEDDDYAYQLFAYAQRTMLIAVKPYIVRETPNSTTRRANDLRRAVDIYAQTIRFAAIAPQIAKVDSRWNELCTHYIRDAISNQVFRAMNDCTVWEQLRFWMMIKRNVNKLKPYLTNRSYARLYSYVLWKLM